MKEPKKPKHELYNQDLEYSKKTLKELLEIKMQFQVALEKHPESKFVNEHLEYVHMKIAERTGAKK